MESSDIGLIGLAVMGQNLVLNMANHGYRVSVFNRTRLKTEDFMREKVGNKSIVPTYTYKELIDSLQSPRKIMFMVKAGKAVDELIEELSPLLSKGDVLIDGGNSNYEDTSRRCSLLESREIKYIGTGVSGGEEGALKGPSIMPGGHKDAWELVKPIFQTISAKVDGEPCCDWVGEEGAGHFVKMVHNGIEYGDMQLISESFHILKEVAGFGYDELSDIFKKWNTGKLESYLIEITGEILSEKDPESGEYMLDVILDAAGQKGTGKWTVNSGLDAGVPVTLIGEAVFARFLSSKNEARRKASQLLSGPVKKKFSGAVDQLVQAVESALLLAKIISYAQGFALMQAVAKTQKWKIDFGKVALMWRGGCIIRSTFLGKIRDTFTKDPQIESLLFGDYFKEQMNKGQESLREVIRVAITHGVATPAMSSALSYFDGYRMERSPANLLQAQRDYFGAHTFERIDKPRGEFFHHHWSN